MENLMPEMSEKFDVVMKQLMLAKKEMGSCVKKDAKNPFHKSTYASLGAHLELCESTLDKYGLIMLQTINGSSEKSMLIATLCHVESGQYIKSYLPLLNPKGDSQGLGASITYMRRYAINSMLGLTAEDDDGESNKKQIATQNREKVAGSIPSGLNKYQVDILKMNESKLDDTCKTKINTWLNNNYSTTNHSELPSECFEKVLIMYENAVKFIEGQVKNA